MTASVTERIEATLDRITEANGSLNCFITIDEAGAMAQALAADERRALRRSLGPLDGVPVAVKDNIDTAAVRTTLGSAMFADRVPDADADVVARLRGGGAIIVGKTNLTELACGTLGHNEHFGACRNPLDLARYPGGSSSGSAAAVAADLVRHAVGSDTGGSIRHPAACCGVVGLKPTFGRTSNRGVSVCSNHLDHVGPIAANVSDAAGLLAVLQHDGADDPRRHIGESVVGRRVAVLRGPFLDECEPDVLAAFSGAPELLRQLGFVVGELDLGIDLAEADEYANDLSADLLEEYRAAIDDAGPAGCGRELRRWCDRYIRVDAARYAAALAAKDAVTRSVIDSMAPWDAVICPTTRVGAGIYAESDPEPRTRRIGNCSLFDLTGQPSLTVPFGQTTSGMPLGLMITGDRDADALVLQIGHAIESTDC